MPPKGSRAKAVVDAPAGGGDPASKSTPGNGTEVVDNLPAEAEVTAGVSGLTIEEKLHALAATVVSDDTFLEDDSDEELEIDTTKSTHPHLRYTAILLFPVIPSREEDAAYLHTKASGPQLLEVYFKDVPTDIPPELVKEVMVTHPLRMRKQSAFAEGHCFHRVLHPVTGTDTDRIKGLVVQHAGDKHRWRHEFRHQLLGGTALLAHYPLLSCPLCGGHHYDKFHNPQILVASPTAKAGGVALICRRHGLSLHNILIHPSGRLVAAELHLDAFHITLVAVYFPADAAERKVFIRSVLGPAVDGVQPGSHLLIMGDFNLVEDPLLDRTSRKGTMKENEDLYRRCDTFRLSDAFRVLHPYKREFTFYSCANQTSSRIDRALISQSLLAHVEFVSHIMPADPISDHSFAVKAAFRMNTRVQLGPGLWRLPTYMLDRPGVRKVIEAVARQADSRGVCFEILISRLNTTLRVYAKEERKKVRATMTHLYQLVAGLKRAWMGDPGCARLKSLLVEKEAQLKGYQLARQERLHVMAQMKEEVLGEVASPHLSAKIKARKGRTQITELNAGGKLVKDNDAILGAASQYYRVLFGCDRQQVESAWSPAPGRSLSRRSAEAVCMAWSEEEVQNAFRSMAKDKAPGKDGLPKELFELHWDILGKHFMQLAWNFAATATLPTSTKDAVTILLHKKGGVVADRMKKVLHEVISPEQYGFLPGRKLSDAVGLVADVIEAAKNKDRDWYLLLVDFRKAFDSVSKGFLFTVLERMGFPSLFVDWVRGLHKDTRTSMLINGWMGEAVDVVSGVRQGCPLVPYLFLCAVEPLAQQAAARNLGLERGHWRLAYLGYANDTTQILQGEEQITGAEWLLVDFEAESGLATNKEKSSILPLGRNLNKQACKTDGFKWVKADEAERLLGVWVTPAGSCTPTWEKAFARIKEKLRQWETQYLTTGES
ncbi:unnamed protein product [Closterium sp. NIES-53]